jgi:MoaA/NifB/PqqE/SkfB family radical SAM enzyme
MKQMRIDILSEKPSEYCNACYQHEESGITSFRKSSIRDYGKYFESNVLDSIQQDGGLDEFKMRYFDIRFSNICNFKCRTCGPDFSSQWEQEFKINWPNEHRIIEDNRKPQLLEDLKKHIQYMDTAYFAGGEPLITEEHYVLLEEMVRQGRKDIILRYNTNLSNLKFKDKDLLQLWKNFDKVYISASVDHYGKRAEYIRKGTDWDKVYDNILKVRELDYIEFSINTVVSIYNYCTMDDFYYFLINNKILTQNDIMYSLYNMVGPKHQAAHVLPRHLKDEARKKIESLMEYMRQNDFKPNQIQQLRLMCDWVDTKDRWDVHGEKFRQETVMIDKVRGDNFVETFPELKELMNGT